MVIKINSASIDELANIDPAQVSSVSIEGYLSNEKLDILNQLLNTNTQINLVVVTDPGEPEKKDHFTGLQLISQLNNIRNLNVLCFGSQPLENLEPLRGIYNLEHFRLSGNYNKKIDLDPLLESKALKVLELEFGLADKKQYKIINQLTQLAQLKVSTLDVAAIMPNDRISELTVTNTLKNPELITAAFPNLSSFSISYAKGLESFDFLSSLKKLTQLSIGYTQKLNQLPKLANPENINSLIFLHTPNFKGIEQVLAFENLESLAINEFDSIPVGEVAKLEKLKKLKRVVLNFKKDPDQEQFEQLALKSGWKTDFSL
ncbi:hypothetical protein ABIE26_004251 [Pedobacter africanus]|uniref:Uncharacterized protein n=1 Tax=Pedobacter africanus TaxID=151894 RepID=A0ACC6L223_9SPHI|nr:hypothetical protein [Pedobacter africanus]MDR6785541.1 hypothetical protein [Pedobacter africanus]